MIFILPYIFPGGRECQLRQVRCSSGAPRIVDGFTQTYSNFVPQAGSSSRNCGREKFTPGRKRSPLEFLDFLPGVVGPLTIVVMANSNIKLVSRFFCLMLLCQSFPKIEV